MSTVNPILSDVHQITAGPGGFLSSVAVAVTIMLAGFALEAVLGFVLAGLRMIRKAVNDR